MKYKKEEFIHELEKVKYQLTFISSAIAYMDIENFQLNSDDMLGLSIIVDKIKEDIEESIEKF